MIYLIIAQEGDYSDKKTWVVEAFTDEAAAVEEAARLNVESRKLGALEYEYHRRRDELQNKMARAALAEEERSVLPGQEFFHLSNAKREALNARIEAEIGKYPEYDLVDDHTVVAVPLGKHGKWLLP